VYHPGSLHKQLGVASLREAVFWNLASAPARLALGLAQTAVLARTLYGESGNQLAAFALFASAIATAVLLTSLGTPQIFSKVVTDRIAKGSSTELRGFVASTFLLRGIAWAIVGVLLVPLALWLPEVLPTALRDTAKDGLVLALWLVWGLLFDLSGLTGRLLSAAYEQKWQNAVNVVSQALAVLVIGGGLLFTDHALILALFGMCVMYAARTLGHWMAAPSLGGSFTVEALGEGLAIWRSESGQAFHATLDKFSSYLLSPHFVMLAGGYLLTAEALASLYLVFDVASKVIAALAVPIAGLALPALGHAKVLGAAQLKSAIHRSVAAIRVTGVLVALFAGALAIPTAEILYGQSLRYEPAFVCALIAIVSIEFMVLEIVTAFMMVESDIGRLWKAKAATTVVALIVASGTGLVVQDTSAGLAMFFVFRLLSVPYWLSLTRTPAAQLTKTSILIGSVIAGALVGHWFYQIGVPWIWRTVGSAFAVSLLLCVLALISVLRSDVATVRRAVHV
jgi:hypothetical protein